MAQRITTDKVHVYGPTSDASNSNEKRTSSGAVLKRLLPYLAPFRLHLSFAFVLVVVTALVQAAGPALLGQAIDFYIVGKDHNGLARTMLLLLGIYIVGLVAQGGQTYRLVSWSPSSSMSSSSSAPSKLSAPFIRRCRAP